MLNHKKGKPDETYNKHEYADEKQVPLETVELKFAKITTGTAGNVIPRKRMVAGQSESEALRYQYSTSNQIFGLAEFPKITPRFNVAPTQQVTVIVATVPRLSPLGTAGPRMGTGQIYPCHKETSSAMPDFSLTMR